MTETRPGKHHEPDFPLTEVVGYLDGELDDSQMRQVEQRLINDPSLRAEADLLSRTWAMLDELEEVSSSHRFTQQTLATISAETLHDHTHEPRRLLRGCASFLATHKVIPCFLVGLLGGLSGLMLSENAADRRQHMHGTDVSRVLVENFELLQNTDAYSAVPDAAVLESLSFPPTSSGDSP
jgi:anti-sigma factor RsiW